MLVLAAAAIVISLIVQGFILEPLARLAGFGPAASGTAHEETLARLHMAEAGLARLDELADSGATPDEVIDRLRSGLQARIGTTRARPDQGPSVEPGALSERELRGDLITAKPPSCPGSTQLAASAPPPADGCSSTWTWKHPACRRQH